MSIGRDQGRAFACLLDQCTFVGGYSSSPHTRTKKKMSRILIPNVSRDERIGSAFNHLFPVIHQTESAADAVAWDFMQTLFLHPFFLAPLAIYKDSCERAIICTGLQGRMDNYFRAICFDHVFDASQADNREVLNAYLTKSYIPVSRFTVGDKSVDRIQEVLQGIIEAQSGLSYKMRMPISYLLSELIDNIGEHSGSHFGYLFCQRVRRELYIIIADSGRTIYGNYIYAKRYEDIVGIDEAAALRIANEGYSTKNLPTAENRGYGLSRSRKMIVKGLGGAYFMLSGAAFYRQEARGSNEDDILTLNVPESCRWNGTIILLRLPLEVPRGFEFYEYVE